MSSVGIPTIAIVGAGFSGAISAVQILRQWRHGALRVVLVEQSGRFGPGLAYGTRCSKHLLNVPAGNMSALPDEPEHFVRWARNRKLPVNPETFAQRSWYGEYLAWLLNETAREAGPRTRLERVAGFATGLVPQHDGALLILEDGRTIDANRVVVAIGNFPPASPAFAQSDLLNSPHYIGNPWCTDTLNTIQPDEDILILGTGLTALDIVLELYAGGHCGRIHAVSRRGLLPQPHRASEPPRPFAAPSDILKSGRTVIGLLRTVRAAVRTAQAQGFTWHDVIASLRPLTHALWQNWSWQERARFLRHLQPYWDTHRHRVAIEVDAAIRLLRDRRDLVVHRGRIERCSTRGELLDVRIRPRGESETYSLAVARIINATGPDSKVWRSGGQLFENLLQQKLIKPDPLELGLLTNDDGAAIDGAGRGSSWLYLIGPLRKAQLWESTAVPELREQARKLASVFCDELADHYSGHASPTITRVRCK